MSQLKIIGIKYINAQIKRRTLRAFFLVLFVLWLHSFLVLDVFFFHEKIIFDPFHFQKSKSALCIWLDFWQLVSHVWPLYLSIITGRDGPETKLTFTRFFFPTRVGIGASYFFFSLSLSSFFPLGC